MSCPIPIAIHCRQEGGQVDRLGAHVGHWQDAAVHAKNAGGCFTFVARFVTYTISLLADEVLQWRCVLTAGNREDKLISTELTLDIGKKLQSMPMQITNDLSIVSKVNVVVLAVPSFAHGQFLRP